MDGEGANVARRVARSERRGGGDGLILSGPASP